METIRNILCLVALCLFAFCIGRVTAPKGKATEVITEKVVRDTITIREPYAVTRRITDTIRIPVIDTLRVTDTLFVQIPREQVRWEDSLAVVYASGIRPRIDSVTHFQSTRYITTTIKKKTRWGLGVSAGVGAGKGGFTPYVGIGINYNILCF